MRMFSGSVLLALVVTIPLLAFEAVGILKKVDADNFQIQVNAGGQDRTVRVARDAKILGSDDKPLADGLRARELKEGTEVTLTIERQDGQPVIQMLRVGKRAAGVPETVGKASVGLKPLTELSAEARYKGEDGGLYGQGKNTPPEGHLANALKMAEKITPLDAQGRPAREGRIALISISMSNATQEFSWFKREADADPARSPSLTIVDCAQGGQAMAEWVDPKAAPWSEAERRLTAAGIDPRQVQVVWIKLANKGPTGDLAEHGRKLEKDTLAVIQNARTRFPNVKIAYLSSRIYGGYSAGRLNPEPYAYEGAFAVRWLIQAQIRGDAALNHDPARGEVKAPLLLWGPYLWADGTTPRKSDGLIWERRDLAADGTHPSDLGRKKVSDQLLGFFKSDPTTKRWFLK